MTPVGTRADGHRGQVGAAMAWAVEQMGCTGAATRWSVVGSNPYSTVLAARSRGNRAIVKLVRSPTAAAVPLIYRMLGDGAPVPTLRASTRIGPVRALLFDHLPFTGASPDTTVVVEALGRAQRSAAAKAAAAPVQLALTPADLLTAAQTISAEASAAPADGPNVGRYSARLLRFAGASTATVAGFPLNSFWRRWKDRLRAWTETVWAAPAPLTVDHADLHIGNARLTQDRRCILIDWDDALVGPPFLSLDKLVASDPGLSTAAALDGYLAEFGMTGRRAHEVAVAGAALGAVRDWRQIRETLVRTGRPQLVGAYARAWAVRTERFWRMLTLR